MIPRKSSFFYSVDRNVFFRSSFVEYAWFFVEFISFVGEEDILVDDVSTKFGCAL